MSATSPPSRWPFRCLPAPARSPRPCCWPVRRTARPLWLGILLGTIVLVAAASFRASRRGPYRPAIGITGNIVLSRLLGVILAALAVQFVIDGVRAAWTM